MNEIDTDVVIVGGGLAGLTAGGRLARGGHRVTVVEAGTDDQYLCNSRIASGSYQLAHSDPTLDAATLRDAIMADTEGAADPELAAVVAAVAGEAMQWLRAEGTKFIKVSHGGKGASWSMAPPRPATPSFGWEGRGPDLTLRSLTKEFQSPWRPIGAGHPGRTAIVRGRTLCRHRSIPKWTRDHSSRRQHSAGGWRLSGQSWN